MEWKKDHHAVPCHTNLICRGRLEDQIWCSLNSHFMLYVFLWCPFYLHIKLFSCKPSLCGYICFISTTLGKNKSVAYWLWVFQACGLVKCFLGLKWSLLQIYYGTTRHSVQPVIQECTEIFVSYNHLLECLWTSFSQAICFWYHISFLICYFNTKSDKNERPSVALTDKLHSQI